MDIKKTIRNGLVGLVMGASLIASPIKAGTVEPENRQIESSQECTEDMIDKTIVNNVATIQEYLEDKGYEVSINGIGGKKDYLINVDNDIGYGQGKLNPKISILPSSDTLTNNTWVLFYNEHNEEDYMRINCCGQSALAYERLGNYSQIKSTLDKYFDNVLDIKDTMEPDTAEVDSNSIDTTLVNVEKPKVGKEEISNQVYLQKNSVNYSIGGRGVYDLKGRLIRK